MDCSVAKILFNSKEIFQPPPLSFFSSEKRKLGFKEILTGKNLRGREENSRLPPLSYYNLQEIQAAKHVHFYQPIDDVASVLQQHASSSYRRSLAGIRNRSGSIKR